VADRNHHCQSIDTSTAVEHRGATTISKGQELSDLQRALNDGAITQKEYESLREKIMKRRD